MRRIALLCIFLSSLLVNSVVAQVSVGETGTLKGTVFGDFYWIPLNHNSGLEGHNGFWIRRIYFTYEREISESFSSRLRLEMNSEGDFLTNSKMSPVVKDAYLKWSNDRHAVYAGISSTPTWGLVEDVWSYRSVEKTPLDLQKMGSSRDFGISLKGSLDSDRTLDYHVMFGNGNSNGPELNKGKKAMLSLSYELTDHLIIEAYGDYNEQSGNFNTSTLQGFLGYRSDPLNGGLLYAVQLVDYGLNAGEQQLKVASAFAHFPITKKLRGIFRVDHMFDPNPAGNRIDYIPFSNIAESTLIIGGIDMALDDNVHLMPNLETVIYGQSESGITPDLDLIPRLTLSYDF